MSIPLRDAAALPLPEAEGPEPALAEPLAGVDEDVSDALFAQALALRDAQDFIAAVGLLRQVLALRPDHLAATEALATTFYMLGVPLNGIGRLDEAEVVLRQAHHLQPHRDDFAQGLATVCHNLGVRAFHAGDYLGAETFLRQALALRPDSPASPPARPPPRRSRRCCAKPC